MTDTYRRTSSCSAACSGNITDEHIRRTIGELPRLCAANAQVVWTRHRRPPDRTPAIRRWFEQSRFKEVHFGSDGPDGFGVGVHQFADEPRPYRPEASLFSFTEGAP